MAAPHVDDDVAVEVQGDGGAEFFARIQARAQLAPHRVELPVTRAVDLSHCGAPSWSLTRSVGRNRPPHNETGRAPPRLAPCSLSLVTVVVDDYDAAIDFFTGVLGFELAADEPAATTAGRAKRWVVVRPPGAATGLLLARADGADQAAVVGQQTAGRVGFFLEVDDFDAVYARLAAAGVRFARPPRSEPYGRVAVFLDIAGNKWDLLGP